MHIEIPKDLLKKTSKEIKEMILEVGLSNFSKILTVYLANPKSIEELKNNPELLEKIAITVDSVLTYYQMTKNTKAQELKQFPINKKLITQFIDLYTTHSKVNYDHC